MKQKLNIFLVLILTIILTSGCVMNTGTRVYDNEKIIAKEYNSYNLRNSKMSIDGNRLSGSADLLEGMGTIWKFNAAENTDMNMTYRIKIASGKAKLVLIHPDSTLTTLVECTADSDNEQELSDTFHAKKGENRIKLIGARDTVIDFEISIDKGEMESF